MQSTRPTIAFLGATGGTTNAVLVNALQGGHHVIALARTPSKLTAQLETHGLSKEVISQQLTVIAGNALDNAALVKLLTAEESGYLVPQIVTGLGGVGSLRWNWCNPLNAVHIDQPTLCGDAAKALVAALSQIITESPTLKVNKPHLTFVSTTGISRGPEDVPVGMQFLYHQMLAEPHKDKRVMEATFRDNVEGKDQYGPVFSGVTGVRPTLLTGDGSTKTAIGLDKIRVGTEDAPERGFSIDRADVGMWIYSNLLGDTQKTTKWVNQMVSLTK